LMQIAMFLVLGLLVFPSEVVPVAWEALLISIVLVFVARPIATTLALLPTRFGARETAMVSWVGLRGAVPIVLATFALVEGIEHAELIFNVVFVIVVTSVLLQGTTIPLVARWLHVDAPLAQRGPLMLDAVEAGEGPTALHELVVPADSAAAGRALVQLELPDGALVVLISREDEFVVPKGTTVLEGGDKVLLLADEQTLDDARALLLDRADPEGPRDRGHT